MPGLVAAVNIQPGAAVQRHFLGMTFNVGDLFAVGVAALVIVIFGFVLRAKATSGVPGKFQLIFETIVGAVENQVDSSMGPPGEFVVPLAVTLFVFILLCNWFDDIPTTLPGHFAFLASPTGDINLPLAMAVIVILLMHFTWVRLHGLKSYLGHYLKPYWFLAPINAIEELVKPLTLTLRLFGNIFAGGILIALIAAFPAKWILPIPLLQTLWKVFDTFFVAPVQAFIFSLLTLIYMQSAVTGGH